MHPVFSQNCPTSGTVVGGGDICTIQSNGSPSVMIQVTGWAHGDNIFYMLIKDGIDVPPARDGGFWGENEFSGPGRYTVRAIKGTCSLMMQGYADITYAANIAQYLVGGGGSLCGSTQTFSITLASSQVGVDYELRTGQDVIDVVKTGNGGPLKWEGISNEGVYSIFGKTNCYKPMLGNAIIDKSPDYIPSGTVTGGGLICTVQDNGSPSIMIQVTNWANGDGIFYTLIRNNNESIGAPRDGGFWSENEFPGPGRYTVQAKRESCTSMMTGYADVNYAAALQQFDVYGGGNSCGQGQTLTVTLSGSEQGVKYELRNGQSAVGDLLDGTGGVLSWSVSSEGTYTVFGRTTCYMPMQGQAIVSISDQIVSGSVVGGGSICTIQENGSPGLLIQVTNWAYGDGITYTLLKDGVDITEDNRDGGFWADRELAGAGRYTVRAAKGTCTAMMSGYADVTYASNIQQFDVLPYDENSHQVKLSNSEVGVTYQLRNGQSAINDLKTGTGTALIWEGVTGSGLYTIFGTGSNGCSINMLGQATIESMNYKTSITILTDNIKTLSQATTTDKLTTNDYYDGLGRPIQKVMLQSSPSGNDLILPRWYDETGRESVAFLPFTASNNLGLYKRTAIKFSDSFETSLLYNFYHGTDKVAVDTNPFTKTIFEKSILNRPFKRAGGPGAVWQPDNPNGKSLKYNYDLNGGSEVCKFTYEASTGLLTLSSNPNERFYLSEQLSSTRLTDEANSERIEYSDKQGKLICVKQLVSKTNGVSEYASTYYVYDYFGNLAIVLPPEASKRLISQF